MNYSQLQLFAFIAETGSFTKAGHELNMTQPAVSRAMSTLETELGVKLMIRDRKNGILLTDIGQRLLVHIRDILKGYDKVYQEITAEKGFEVGTIRIGAFPAVSAHFLPRILRTLRERYPGLDYDLREGSIDDIREWLASRIIDVGWIIPPNDDLEIIPFLEDKLFLLLREDHPLQQRAAIHITDLDNEPMIICKGGYDNPIHEIFDRFQVNLRPEFVVNNVNTALNMIQEGLGMGIMSRISLSLSVLPPNVRIRMLEPQPTRQINLAVPSLEDASIAVKLFIRTAKEICALMEGDG
ncbi:LysR family transcriptional regulator [Paenibacillus sp. DYY-L-2]|uniref:LysR family transcriptional regulator n=1 Tax=Paenibacillus sp. DYY-L-2 TaxID=3447013 RepID=UPI003F50363B